MGYFLEVRPREQEESAHGIGNITLYDPSRKPPAGFAEADTRAGEGTHRAAPGIARADDDIQPFGFDLRQHDRQHALVVLHVAIDHGEVIGGTGRKASTAALARPLRRMRWITRTRGSAWASARTAAAV